MTFDVARRIGLEPAIRATHEWDEWDAWFVWWRPQRHKRRLVRLVAPPWGLR